MKILSAIKLLIGRQFGEIITGSKRFAAGDFGYRIPAGSSGELKKLSETLKYMAGKISFIDLANVEQGMVDNQLNQLQFLQNAIGAVPSPMDAFLVLRGVKTLHVRMQRHEENARRIAACVGMTSTDCSCIPQ